MSVLEYDFHSRVTDDLLGTLTDQQLKEMAIRPALYELGSGLFTISRHSALASAALIKKGNVVRVRAPATSATPIWGFVLKDGDFSLISFKEEGGEDLKYSGPGLLYLLEAARLRPTPFAPDQPKLGSLTEVPARDWVWVNEPYGAIATRIVEEGQNEPGTPLRNITLDFDRTVDSAGNLWAVVAEEFRTPIGSNVLEVAERLAAAGDFFLYMDVNLVLHAYQSLDDFTTDRTSLTYATNKVRFVKGQNILTELVRKNDSDPLTHLIQRGSDGDISTEVIPGFNEVTDIANYGWAEAGQTNDGDMLEKIAQRTLAGSRTDADDFELEIKPGNSWANGEYVWSPIGSDARFWWDLVTVHTGTADHDLDNASQRVVACRIVLDQAAKDDDEAKIHKSLHYIPELSHRPYRSFAAVPQNPRQPGSTPDCYCLRLCQEGFTSGFADRLYFTDATAGTLATTPLAAWDNIAASGAASDKQLIGDTSFSLNDVTDSNAGGSGVVLNSLLGTFFWELGTELAAKIAAGGLTVRCYLLTRTRHGAGINDSAQDMVSQIGLWVTQGATSTPRGTALPLHSLGSSGGSEKWPSAIATSRQFPPAAASDVTSAVGGTVAGDRLIVEVGYRNFTVPVASGGAIRFVNGEASDLPANESTTTILNGWIELSDSGAAIGGCEIMDTVLQGLENLGESPFAAHGDHEHAHGLLSADGLNYHDLNQINGYVHFDTAAPTTSDDEDDGYSVGVHWIDTTTGDVYIATDVTAGAAVWTQINGGGGGGSTLTVEEEDGSPSVTSVTTIQVPNGRLTNDGGGIVSLDFASSGHTHGGGSGGGALVIPTLLQSVKAAADTPDDEFGGTSLDGKWTAVDGSAGTVAMLAAAGTGVYQVGARDGWLAMQVGPAAGDSVELRQDYTLPDGKCIVAYLTWVADNSVSTIANNEIWTGIGVNDNDAGVFAGTTGQTAHALFDTDTSGYRVLGLAGTTPTYVGSNFAGAESFQTDNFFRIDRSGLNYDLFHSADGFGWSYIGRKTMATAANNIWLWAWCNAAMSQRMVVWCPWIRQGTALSFDPWPL